jgi:hypothetical protein
MRPWLVALVVAGACGGEALAEAAPRARRRFDPEDLQLEEPGVLHADLAFGLVRGEEAGRWLLPDFDVDLGLASNVEIGIDGAWSLEGTPQRLFARDHAAPDNLWFSSKIGLWSASAESAGDGSWACGAQLGPRVALAPDAHGTGFQGLFLLGRTFPGVHLVASGGGMVDPGGAVSSQRPVAALAGIDGEIALGKGSRVTLAVDVSGVFFVANGKHQLVTTAGPVWAATPWLDLGVSGLLGVLSGGDRYGAYLTAAPRIQLF